MLSLYDDDHYPRLPHLDTPSSYQIKPFCYDNRVRQQHPQRMRYHYKTAKMEMFRAILTRQRFDQIRSDRAIDRIGLFILVGE